MSAPVLAYGEATCDEVIDTDDGPRLCAQKSAFVVTRSDGDKSYGFCDGASETCEDHLAGTVASMINGDETVSAVVAARWLAPVGSAS